MTSLLDVNLNRAFQTYTNVPFDKKLLKNAIITHNKLIVPDDDIFYILDLGAESTDQDLNKFEGSNILVKYDYILYTLNKRKILNVYNLITLQTYEFTEKEKITFFDISKNGEIIYSVDDEIINFIDKNKQLWSFNIPFRFEIANLAISSKYVIINVNFRYILYDISAQKVTYIPYHKIYPDIVFSSDDEIYGINTNTYMLYKFDPHPSKLFALIKPSKLKFATLDNNLLLYEVSKDNKVLFNLNMGRYMIYVDAKNLAVDGSCLWDIQDDQLNIYQ